MFSVVIPLYNKREYVHRAVASVLAQTFVDFEIIVIDDGSTDASAEEIESIKDYRLQVHRQDNCGEGAARNAGINLASREWVAFLDADDEWLPGHLDELRGLIDAYPNAGLVSGGTVELRQGESVEKKYLSVINRGPIDYFDEASKRPGIVNSSSCAVRRDLLAAIAGFGRAPVGCDTETWARIALMAPVIISTKVTNLYHRGTAGVMERLESENPPIKVRSLADVSAAADTLIRRMRDPMPHHVKESVGRYISAQAFGLMRVALYRGQIESAKEIYALIEARESIPLYYRMALQLPSAVLILFVSIYRYVRLMRKWKRK